MVKLTGWFCELLSVNSSICFNYRWTVFRRSILSNETMAAFGKFFDSASTAITRAAQVSNILFGLFLVCWGNARNGCKNAVPRWHYSGFWYSRSIEEVMWKAAVGRHRMDEPQPRYFHSLIFIDIKWIVFKYSTCHGSIYIVLYAALWIIELKMTAA